MAPQLKETDYIKTWALFAVCSTVGGVLAGGLVGGMLGAVLGAAGMPVQSIKLVCGGAGFIAGLPISYLFFRLFVSRFIVQKLKAQIGTDGVTLAA